MKNRTLFFLAASFLSAIGDALLVFAVPSGIGIETHDMRAAILMWLIPAVAMFASSFFNKSILARPTTVRSDYGRLLLGIAFLEVIIATLAYKITGHTGTLILICGFVFFYAIAKEGIPRLLYHVTVYRFFIKPDEYSKIAGIDNGLTILASLLGTSLAARLVLTGDWRFSLVWDAVTFIAFGSSILIFGQNIETESERSLEKDVTMEKASGLSPLSIISIVVPLLFATNALVWNYLPLLSQKLSVAGISTSILLIGFLRLPGMIAGLSFDKISKFVPLNNIISVVPAFFLVVSLLFVFWPSVFLLVVLILAEGLLQGLYWPADFSIRNTLGHARLVGFNTSVLRRLASFQFVACCAALLIYSPGMFTPGRVLTMFVVLAVVGIALSLKKQRTKALVGGVTAAIISGVGCSAVLKNQTTTVVLPSISRNLELRPELTYSGMSIINDTSAHLLTVAPDLTIKGQVLKKYEQLDSGKKYVFELDPEYTSGRGEKINADDVRFTIIEYLSKIKDLANVFTGIVGANNCSQQDCNLEGVKIDGPLRLTILLVKPDIQFIDKLASPWLILYKKDKPILESIGNCRLPYQTGPAQVTQCDNTGVHLKIGTKEVFVTDIQNQKNASVLITNNPGKTVSPTLTVMAAFANPSSKTLNSAQRINILTKIRQATKTLSAQLNLKWSPLLTPQWLAIEAPKDLLQITQVSATQCPRKPIKILLDTSLPNLEILKSFLTHEIKCPLAVTVTNGDTYLTDFKKTDIGVAWFTPDFLDIYNIFSIFDCEVGGSCYFNWKDKELASDIRKLREASQSGSKDSEGAIKIERLLLKRGYAAPISEMNWWIQSSNLIKPIHPAGLFQVHVSDFL